MKKVNLKVLEGWQWAHQYMKDSLKMDRKMDGADKFSTTVLITREIGLMVCMKVKVSWQQASSI